MSNRILKYEIPVATEFTLQMHQQSRLEYNGIISKVLEGLHPQQIVLYTAEKILDREVRIHINMEHETHFISLFVDCKIGEIEGQTWIQTCIPSPARCGEAYGTLLENCINDALAEFKEFCKRKE